MLTTRLPSYCIGAGRKLSYSHRATHCCLYLHAVQLGTNESWEVKTNRLEMFLVLQPQLMSGWQPWRNRSVTSYQLLWLRQDSCSASVYHFRFNGRLADKSESTNQFCSCTHTHTFNGPFSGTTKVSWYQKGKTNLDFTGARDSEWQWHQLGCMQVCTLLQTDNHASTPPVQ